MGQIPQDVSWKDEDGVKKKSDHEVRLRDIGRVEAGFNDQFTAEARRSPSQRVEKLSVAKNLSSRDFVEVTR